VLDEDRVSRDDNLGTITKPVRYIYEKGHFEEWMELAGVKHGKIKMRFEWHDLSKDEGDLEAAIEAAGENPLLSGAYLSVFVGEARQLPIRKRRCLSSDVHIKIKKLDGSPAVSSRSVDFNNPTWRENFLIPIKNPKNEELRFEIQSEYSSFWSRCFCCRKSPLRLATVRWQVAELLRVSSMSCDKIFQLDNADPKSTLSLAMCLRILKLKKIPEVSTE